MHDIRSTFLMIFHMFRGFFWISVGAGISVIIYIIVVGPKRAGGVLNAVIRFANQALGDKKDKGKKRRDFIRKFLNFFFGIYDIKILNGKDRREWFLKKYPILMCRLISLGLGLALIAFLIRNYSEGLSGIIPHNIFIGISFLFSWLLCQWLSAACGFAGVCYTIAFIFILVLKCLRYASQPNPQIQRDREMKKKILFLFLVISLSISFVSLRKLKREEVRTKNLTASAPTYIERKNAVFIPSCINEKGEFEKGHYEDITIEKWAGGDIFMPPIIQRRYIPEHVNKDGDRIAGHYEYYDEHSKRYR